MRLTEISLILPMVFAPVPSWAKTWYPPSCCPGSCAPVEGAFQLIFESPDSRNPTIKFGKNRIPFSEHLHRGQSRDNRTHICIGYSFFGDEEIKCLFTPPMM